MAGRIVISSCFLFSVSEATRRTKSRRAFTTSNFSSLVNYVLTIFHVNIVFPVFWNELRHDGQSEAKKLRGFVEPSMYHLFSMTLEGVSFLV